MPQLGWHTYLWLYRFMDKMTDGAYNFLLFAPDSIAVYGQMITVYYNTR